MKSIFSNKRIWVMFVVLLCAVASMAASSTLAKYTSVQTVGTFDLHIEPEPHAYAVYSDDGSLDFYNGIYPEVGTTLENGKTVMAVYHDHIDTTVHETPEWHEIASDVKSVSFVDTISPISTSGWFSGFTNATFFDLKKLDTSNTTDMSGMFSGCYSLETLQLGDGFGSGVGSALSAEYIGLKTVALDWVKDGDADEITCDRVLTSGAGEYVAKVIYCYATFADQTLRIYQRRYVPAVGETYDDGFETYTVGGVYSWRNGNTTSRYTTCEGGRPPKNVSGNVLSNWKGGDSTDVCYVKVVDEAQPQSLSSWFRDFLNLGYYGETYPLKIVDLRNLDTSRVEDMSYMFYNCNKLTTIDFTKFEKFDTSNVTDMSYMFSKCFYMQTLNLSNFNTSNVTNMNRMFDMTSTSGFKSFLKTIVVSDEFIIGESTTAYNMFLYCAILMGGAGTEFTASGKQYAVIDGGSDAPGYFTGVSQACTCESQCTDDNRHECPRCGIANSNGYNYCKEYMIPPKYNSAGTQQESEYS